MRKAALVVGLALIAGGAQASSYLDIFGTVHQPIQDTSGGIHWYPGNLGPDAILNYVDLSRANLPNANLSNVFLAYASLSGAVLTGANLSGSQFRLADLRFADLRNAHMPNVNMADSYLAYADFENANLSGADMISADLTGANLSGANLSGATNLWNSGTPYYDALTDFSGTLFDPVTAGWILIPIPEPSTALLLGLGLVGIAARRRV